MKWVDESPAADWPLLPAGLLAPDATVRRTTVVAPPDLHRAVLAHLRGRATEQGGLLSGVPYHRPADACGMPPALVRLVDCVAGQSSDASLYSLTLRASVWSMARDRLEQLQPGQPMCRIIGWYHSHPGFGAFFSDTDRRTQAAFFREPCAVGWVIDPSDDSHAVFVGPVCEPAWLRVEPVQI